MTREEAKSELMQIYGSLSEEKKQALDVLMAQADVTDDDIATMRILFNADIECLCNQGRFNDAKEMEQIRDRLMARLQADGEYISRQAVMDCYKKWQPYMATRLHEFEKELSELPSVPIPPEHDGCKDCKYETYPEYYYPCCECKQNYMDEWKAMPSAEPKTGHWIEHPEIETSTPEYLMFYECSECGDKQCFCKSDIQKKHFCNNCGAKMIEPTCDTCEYTTAAFNPCNACKDKSEYKPQEISDRNLKMWHDIYGEEKRRMERSK